MHELFLYILLHSGSGFSDLTPSGNFVAGFVMFGEDVGDSIGPRADDGTTSSIGLSEPIIYFEEEYDTFFVSLCF